MCRSFPEQLGSELVYPTEEEVMSFVGWKKSLIDRLVRPGQSVVRDDVGANEMKEITLSTSTNHHTHRSQSILSHRPAFSQQLKSKLALE